MKYTKLKLTIFIVLLIAVYFILNIKDSTNNEIEQVNANKQIPTKPQEATDLKEVKPTELNKQELEDYYSVYKNPSVIYLRKALNAYLANDIKSVNISETAIKADQDTGLDAFDKSYYKSKFVVVSFNKGLFGGFDIYVIFQDKPDRIFYAWVYPLAEDGYELRGFGSEEPDPKEMNKLNEAYKNFLYDTEHAL